MHNNHSFVLFRQPTCTDGNKSTFSNLTWRLHGTRLKLKFFNSSRSKQYTKNWLYMSHLKKRKYFTSGIQITGWLLLPVVVCICTWIFPLSPKQSSFKNRLRLDSTPNNWNYHSYVSHIQAYKLYIQFLDKIIYLPPESVQDHVSQNKTRRKIALRLWSPKQWFLPTCLITPVQQTPRLKQKGGSIKEK